MDPSHLQEIPIIGAIITVSSTRTEDSDSSGKSIKSAFQSNGIPVNHYRIIPDDIEAIRKECLHALEIANCIVISGGTGLTSDDCTIEAIAPLLEKKMDGFGELFRLKSYEEIGTRAILSRAIGGINQKKAIFCIPGSFGAAELAMSQLIIPEIRHILTHASR